MDGEVIDPLSRLVLETLEDDLVIEIFDLSSDDHRIDRNRADRHRALLDQGETTRVDVSTGRKVHRRIGAPALGPLQFLDFFIGAR